MHILMIFKDFYLKRAVDKNMMRNKYHHNNEVNV